MESHFRDTQLDKEIKKRPGQKEGKYILLLHSIIQSTLVYLECVHIEICFKNPLGVFTGN